MKKIISILLCALMLVSALCVPVFAEETDNVIEFTDSVYEFSKDKGELGEEKNYIIKSGCTFVVPAQRTLNVPYSSTLTVEEGAHLVVNGQLNAVGDVAIYGKMTGLNVSGQENITCYVEFPDLTASNIKLDDKINVCYYLGKTNDPYGDVGVAIADYVLVDDTGIISEETGNYLPVPYNTYMYVRVLIEENGSEDKYDDKLFPVKCNNVVIPFNQNACPILVTAGSEISFDPWVNDSTYYNTYTIILPEGDGYTVYGRNGELGEVTLKYGQAFSFRVELEEDYNQSVYQVYVYNGNGWTDLTKEELLEGIAPAVPDAEGYYTIANITGNHSIYVEGVISNEMLDMFSQVFNIFRQIWEAITKIFNALFGEGGSLDGIFGGLL